MAKARAMATRLNWIFRGVLGKAHAGGQLCRFCGGGVAIASLCQHDVFRRRHMPKQLETLKDHADARAQLGNVLGPIADRDAVNRDCASAACINSAISSALWM
jgi:hypothetical protein